MARWLRDEGHEVFSVYEEMRGASDSDLLRVAELGDWILITGDKDFGEMVFREHRSHEGVVLLRLSDERARSK